MTDAGTECYVNVPAGGVVLALLEVWRGEGGGDAGSGRRRERDETEALVDAEHTGVPVRA